MAGTGFKVKVEHTERWERMLREGVQRVAASINKSLGIAVAWVRRDAVLAAPHKSGHLRRHIRGRVESSTLLGASFGVVGSDVVYARIQELGGVVKARNAKYLTIPLAGAKTKAGIVRGGARTFSETFVIRSRSGNLLIMQRRGRGVLPLFVLKPKVEIRGSHYLERGLEKNRAPIRELFGREVKSALEA